MIHELLIFKLAFFSLSLSPSLFLSDFDSILAKRKAEKGLANVQKDLTSKNEMEFDSRIISYGKSEQKIKL
jgi:hypothetical protein